MRSVRAGSSPRPKGRWLLPASLLAAVTAPLAVLGAVTWVLPRPSSGLAADVHPVGYPVRTGTTGQAAAATATLSWHEGPDVYAPDWSGLVLSVELTAGQTVTTGTPVAVVDGITRLAVATPTPFYRMLGAGDQGADVAMLRQALAALGLGDFGTSPRFDASLRAGVRALCRQVGCPATTTVVDPSWFVFLPEASLTVAATHLVADQPAPASGEAILTGVSTLTGIAVGPKQEADGATTTGFPTTGRGFEFVAGDSTVPLADDFRAAGSLHPLAATVAAGTRTIDGTVRLIHPVTVSSVPTTALVTGATGDICVYPSADEPAAAGAGDDLSGFAPLVVRVVGGEPGVTTVEPIDADQVLANPSDLPGLPPCR